MDPRESFGANHEVKAVLDSGASVEWTRQVLEVEQILAANGVHRMSAYSDIMVVNSAHLTGLIHDLVSWKQGIDTLAE